MGKRKDGAYPIPKAQALQMLAGRPCPCGVSVDVLLGGALALQGAACIIQCWGSNWYLVGLARQLPSRPQRVLRYEAPVAAGSRWRVHLADAGLPGQPQEQQGGLEEEGEEEEEEEEEQEEEAYQPELPQPGGLSPDVPGAWQAAGNSAAAALQRVGDAAAAASLPRPAAEPPPARAQHVQQAPAGKAKRHGTRCPVAQQRAEVPAAFVARHLRGRPFPLRLLAKVYLDGCKVADRLAVVLAQLPQGGGGSGAAGSAAAASAGGGAVYVLEGLSCVPEGGGGLVVVSYRLTSKGLLEVMLASGGGDDGGGVQQG